MSKLSMNLALTGGHASAVEELGRRTRRRRRRRRRNQRNLLRSPLSPSFSVTVRRNGRSDRIDSLLHGRFTQGRRREGQTADGNELEKEGDVDRSEVDGCVEITYLFHLLTLVQYVNQISVRSYRF